MPRAARRRRRHATLQDLVHAYRSGFASLHQQRNRAEEEARRALSTAEAQSSAALARTSELLISHSDDLTRLQTAHESTLSQLQTQLGEAQEEISRLHITSTRIQAELAQSCETVQELRAHLRAQEQQQEREHETLRGEHETLRGALAALAAAGDAILADNPAAWGVAHLHLRDLLAQHRLPLRRPPPLDINL